jgi:C-terminal processing protease CtpA/Prc
MELAYDFSKVFDAIREEETSYTENPFQYGSKDDIGYVKLRNFVGDMAERALWKVKGSRALIIDVRGNPGGEVDDLQRFAGYLEKS